MSTTEKPITAWNPNHALARIDLLKMYVENLRAILTTVDVSTREYLDGSEEELFLSFVRVSYTQLDNVQTNLDTVEAMVRFAASSEQPGKEG